GLAGKADLASRVEPLEGVDIGPHVGADVGRISKVERQPEFPDPPGERLAAEGELRAGIVHETAFAGRGGGQGARLCERRDGNGDRGISQEFATRVFEHDGSSLSPRTRTAGEERAMLLSIDAYFSASTIRPSTFGAMLPFAAT